MHLGDIGTSSPEQGCGDPWLAARKAQFSRIRHPFVLVPGDNEWSNCADPVARLRHWRDVFCFQEKISMERQEGRCEHLRWEAGGLVFVTLNVPGPDNNRGHPEHGPRMQAVLEWLDEAAALAASRDGLVVLMQANPFGLVYRRGYDALIAALERLAARRPGRVTLVHGDTHVYRVDEPIPGLRRIEVWGAPFVSWLPAAAAGGGVRTGAPRFR